MTARVIPLRPRLDLPRGDVLASTAQRARRRRKTTVVSGAAAAAALAAVAAVLLQGGDARPAAPARSRPTASSPPPAATSGPDLTWTEHQGVFIPSSAEAGPHAGDGVLQTGFADSDLGAALAAVHIAYRASPAPGPRVFRAALARQVTGPAAPALAATVESDYTQARVASRLRDGAPLGTGTVVFTGYVVTALPGGNRHVQVLERAPDANGVPQVFALDVVVTRMQGDWRVMAPSDGTWASAASQLPAAPRGVTPLAPPAPGAR